MVQKVRIYEPIDKPKMIQYEPQREDSTPSRKKLSQSLQHEIFQLHIFQRAVVLDVKRE